jgi:hypothetical protein
VANNVFANGREISCKKADGKSICAFPDVCMTPPENPATPPGVPVPYPNTGFAKDTTKGSKNVKISGKEVMLRNKSYFKKSTGDEPGCAAKKGVVTSVNRGKVYFNAWSMNVIIEGQNAVRHLDITTHNHASPPGNSPPLPYTDTMAVPSAREKSDKECEDAKKEKKRACGSIPQLKKGRKVIKNLDNEKMTAHLECEEINLRIKGFNDCLAARRDVTNKCFDGVTDARAIEELEFGGSLDIVRLLIANGADVNAVYVDTGLTGLHAAVFSENIEVIKLVLDAGADPNIPDNEDTSPLKFSVEQGSFEMAKLLLEYGAERTINEAGGFCGCTALALAASKLDIAMIELLLKNGADPDTRDADGQTARQYLPPPDESDNEAWDAARDLLQGG